MLEISSEQAAQSRESGIVTSPILVHSQRSETLAEHTQHLISIRETESTGNDSVGDKLLREAQVLTWGIGGAFGDVVENPLSKLPEAATAGTFGVGLRALERAGTKGKVMAGVVGAGMFAKMGYDEWRAERWSEFGGALGAAWDSQANFYSSVEATKHSIGSLAVDMTVGTAAFKVAGLYNPVGSRAAMLSRSETGLSFSSSGRSLSNVTEFSLMGQRSSRALGEPTTSLRLIAKPAPISEFTLMGQRCTTALSEASSKHHSSLAANSLDALSARAHDPLRLSAHDLVSLRKHGLPAGKQIAKSEPLDKVVPPQKLTVTDALKSKLLTAHGAEEFGYLSAIREVTAVETVPGFVPSRRAYNAIAETLDSYARLADPDYAQKYHAVSELVKLHAQTFNN